MRQLNIILTASQFNTPNQIKIQEKKTENKPSEGRLLRVLETSKEGHKEPEVGVERMLLEPAAAVPEPNPSISE